MKILKFILSRGIERSTWIGITTFISALGVALNPEQTNAIIATGVGVAGLIAAFTKDTK